MWAQKVQCSALSDHGEQQVELGNLLQVSAKVKSELHYREMVVHSEYR